MALQKTLVCGFLALCFAMQADAADESKTKVIKFARFQIGDVIAYGIVEGDRVRQLAGDLFGAWKRSEKTYPLDEVKLLVPTRPSQILALAGNYRSHLGQTETITTTVKAKT